jgi:diphthamide synthase (EF-2-diphthine--ammonia ligase)
VNPAGGKIKALLSWSSGKDSAWSLHVLRGRGEVEVAGLLTTVNEAYARVAMHAVRTELLEAQAEATGLPLWQIPLPNPCSNERYEEAMRGAVERAKAEDIGAIAFGDLFLADIRAYREERLRGSGVRPLFPIWARPTDC